MKLIRSWKLWCVVLGLACSIGVAILLLAHNKNIVQVRLDALTHEPGVPGAAIEIRDSKGQAISYVSGVAEINSKKMMPATDAYYRIASLTKPIIAAAVMQLVSENAITLDTPIEHYLPGVVRGSGNGAAINGNTITVRQILQHTSGLPEFAEDIDPSKGPFSPQAFLDVAFAKAPTSAPGQKWAYSNANYVLAGELIKKVTGQDFRTVTSQRIFQPLGMEHTYWPEANDQTIKSPSAHNYTRNKDGSLADLTEFPGYEAGASGGLISTTADMNRFWDGLFANRLFPAETLQTMLTSTVKMPDDAGQPANSSYGLGIVSAQLSCNQAVWLHGGDFPMVASLSGHSLGGSQATVYTIGRLTEDSQRANLLKVLDTALCKSKN